MRRVSIMLGLALAACAGSGPRRSVTSYRDVQGLSPDAPVVLVDVDDTIYERGVERPMAGAAEALGELATDHLIVYLTARSTHAKLPGVTKNREDTHEFLEENGFPSGPLFTSSLSDNLFLGEGRGKVRSFERLRDFGVERVALAVGDRPHDLEAYLENGFVDVERVVVILIEAHGEEDTDRSDLPEAVTETTLEGSGPVWPILDAYREGALILDSVTIAIQEPGGSR